MASPPPQALSISEIRNYMLANGCKVTNHALVKHFKRFLTGDQQNEARKQFKTYVNILATIKNENQQKFLILRKKYINECPTEEAIERALNSVPSSPSVSLGFDNSSSGSAMSSPRPPPPYKPPPEVSTAIKPATATTAPTIPPLATGISVQQENVESYGDCVQEFAAALRGLNRATTETTCGATADDTANLAEMRGTSVSRINSVEESNNNNKENIPRFSFSSGASGTSTVSGDSIKSDEQIEKSDAEAENPISVKEATRKFNRMASEEEAKMLSPPPPQKKKSENALIEKNDTPPVTYNHPKAKEWIVSMAKANYQELAKLAHEYPELVKLQDPATGYTALHWAAKHGNEDVVKLIAGTHKADVNARSNGGYTPLHLAVQFGRIDIFELLCNVYKANRDITDYSGNKPLDYSQQRTSVSASTYSKIKARRKNAVERDLSFLRIGSLRIGSFLGVGSNGNGAATIPLSNVHRRPQHQLHQTRRNHAAKTISTPLSAVSNKNSNVNNKLGSRVSAPANSKKFENVHKSWGSADSIPHTDDANTMDDTNVMPPPKSVDSVNKRPKHAKRGSVTSCATDSPRHSISSSNSSSNLNSGYSSMPTTPNQLRSPMRSVDADAAVADSDSDSACGFGSHWSVGEGRELSKM